MSTMLPFIGIDFGTSKCAMAWYNPQTGQAQIIRNFEGKDETPSVVYLGKSENEIVVGELAMRKLGQNPKDQQYLVVSVKRNLLTAPAKVLDGNRMYRPVDIAALILGKLRVDTETQHFHEPVTRAVITYPASFGPLQQDKIKQAATTAGFSEVALLPEPIAAALAYGYTGLKVGNCILVYDFGGGTFDVAVLARGADRSFIWATEPKGLETCGGDDLDRELYDYCEEIARQQLHRGISLDDDINLRFLFQCRERKENLSAFSEEDFSSYLPSDNGPVLFQHTLKREMFEQRIKKYIDQTVSLTQEVMRGAEAGGSKVDTVVLIGGSSRIPMVPRSLSSTLSVQPQEFAQKDFAVALGAAYYGLQIWSPPNGGGKRTSQQLFPTEEYRNAVRNLWEPTKSLTRAQVSDLDSLVKRLRLNTEVAKTIEREVMGHSKEDILAQLLTQQHFAALAEYRTAVARAWSDQVLTPTKMNDLSAQVIRLGLSKDEAADIERQVMGDTKEVIWGRQRRQNALSEYRAIVNGTWGPNKMLTQPQLDVLTTQMNRLGLSKDEAATVEREVMGDTREAIFKRQYNTTPPPRPGSNRTTIPVLATLALVLIVGGLVIGLAINNSQQYNVQLTATAQSDAINAQQTQDAQATQDAANAQQTQDAQTTQSAQPTFPNVMGSYSGTYQDSTGGSSSPMTLTINQQNQQSWTGSCTLQGTNGSPNNFTINNGMVDQNGNITFSINGVDSIGNNVTVTFTSTQPGATGWTGNYIVSDGKTGTWSVM